MKNKKDIENAVCQHFKVKVEDLYEGKKHTYPEGIARTALIYLLYEQGNKSYIIAENFGVTQRLIQMTCAKVSVALKSDTKIREDIAKIKRIIQMSR